MHDVFKEQLVKQTPSGRDVAKRVGFVLAFAALCFLAMLFLPQLFLVVALAAGFGLFWLMGRQNREFEYIFTNGDLDIDVIMGKNARKRVFSGDVKTDAVELVVPLAERGYDTQFRGAVKRDCSSGSKENGGVYRVLANYKGKKLDIWFEPNDILLSALSPYLGQRKLVKKK